MSVRYGPGQARERERDVRQRNALDELGAHTRLDVSCVRPYAEALEHRATDWRRPAGHESAGGKGARAGGWVCGLCHPAAVADVERRPISDLASPRDDRPQEDPDES